MDMKVANKLYELRKSKGYSQDELAELLNVSRQAVSKWERGESSPDTDNLIALAKLYGVSIDELLDYKPSNRTEDVFEDINNSSNDNTNSNKKRGVHIDIPFIKIDVDDDEHVDVNADGVHISDGCDSIHIDDDGVRINDCCDGDSVHIDNKGLHLSDGNNTVSIGKDGIVINDTPMTKEQLRHHAFWHSIIDGATAILCVVAYLVMGFVAGLWHPGWIVFLAIPTAAGFVDMFMPTKKGILEFPMPILVVASYLLMGFLAGLWHPGWVIFFAVPLFYIIAKPIHNAYCLRKVKNANDDFIADGKSQDIQD